MLPEGDLVEVLVASHETSAGAVSEAIPIEMGGQGKLVELLGVHYLVNYPGSPTGPFILCLGLSSNPNHLLTPPAHRAAFLEDVSIYGAHIHCMAPVTAGENYATSHVIDTKIIPLYGIIRPRRQVFVVRGDTGTAILIRIEVYYRPIAVKGVLRNVIDRKFGKYRRS